MPQYANSTTTALGALLVLGLGAGGSQALAVDVPPPPDSDADQVTGVLWVEGEAGHDSNPTTGSALTRMHGAPDSFLDYQGSGKLTVPLVHGLDLVLKEHADDREYQGDLPDDSTLLHNEAQLPVALGHGTSLVPFFYLDDQWYSHDYYSTIQRTGLRWTQNWTSDWVTDLAPYIERDRYRAPNRYQDATVDGGDATLTWWVPGRHILESLALAIGGAIADARAVYASYKQDDVNLDQLYLLPGRVRADLDVDWSPTYYESFAPGTRKLRQDRAMTIDLHLERSLTYWLMAVADASLTSIQSNFRVDQYHEIILSAGLRLTLF